MSTPVFVDPRFPPRLAELRPPECPYYYWRIPVRLLGRLIWMGRILSPNLLRTETPESPLSVAPPTSLPESTPPTLVPILYRTALMAMRVLPAMSPGLSARMAEVAAMSKFALRKRFRSSFESLPPSSPPNLPLRKRYGGTSELVEDDKDDGDEEDKEIKESLDSDSVSEDAKDEGPTAEDKDPAAGDEGLAAGDECPGMGVESCGSDDESRGLDDKGHSVESDGLGLGYEALRRRELALEEDHVYSTFEVGQGSRSAPEPERPERVSASRQPILTTWTDLEDGMIYIDVPAYPPPTSPVQTPSSPEWSSGSLPISPSPFIVPSPISSPMILLIVPSPIAIPATAETEELFPALFKRYDRDIGELFTRLKAIRDEIFS
ncbi:hypothetical protein Tco_0344720 [Tanacetum coccineum]